MSLKLKAFIQLIGLVLAASAGASIVNFIIEGVPKETIWTAIQFGCISGLLYMCYSVILARLEYNESLKKLNDFSKKD